MYIIILIIPLDVNSGLPSLLEHPQPSLYTAVVGRQLILKCEFDGAIEFATWRDALNEPLYPIQEYPNCVRNTNNTTITILYVLI